MTLLRRIFGGLRALFHKADAEQELDEELRDYMQTAAAEKMKAGMSGEEAMRRVRMSMGSPEGVKEKVRGVGWETMAETLWQDIRFALRMLRKSPGFTAVAILTLALGIGANTALFSVVNGVLLNPLPYPQPDRLVVIYAKEQGVTRPSISYLNFLDWVRDNRSFSALAAYRGDLFLLTGIGDPESVPTERVSASLFPLLGVKPVAGRVFRPEEDQLGAGPVALISAGFWKRKFGSSPGAVGKTLTLDGKSYTIIGVIPASFSYQETGFHKSDVFVPIGQWDNPTFRDRRSGLAKDAIGRLKPGVSFAEAKAEMEGIAAHLAVMYPNANKNSSVTLVSLKEDIVGSTRPFLLVLLAAVGLVLLIACTNIANLLLARSTGRSREFAIRAALGAANGRLVRQLLTESVVLALIGGTLGVLLAATGTQAVLKSLPEALPRAEDVHLDAHVLLFALVVSILAGVLFGLAPALKSWRADIYETLKEGGRGTSGVRHRMQRILVAVEMAFAVVLLIGAGLMIRTLARLWSMNPGFDPHNVATFNVTVPTTADESPEAIREMLRRIHDAITTVPGVEYGSWIAGTLPMADTTAFPFWLEGQSRPTSETEMKLALSYSPDPELLKILKIPVERGRFLTAQDKRDTPPVIVIDEDFARLYFGKEDPIGKRVNFAILDISPEIVGIVGHAKQWGLDENGKSPVLAQFYLPLEQIPDRFMALTAQSYLRFLIRTQSSPDAVYSPIRYALENVNGKIVMYDAKSMDKIVSDSLAARRFAMMLLAAFAAVAVLLASIGIYGVITYLTQQRTHEIGIRLALGAQPRDVLRLVLGEGLTVALVGILVGLAAALGLTRLMSSLLFGVSASDPVTFLITTVVLLLVALIACYMPARRAMRVDPMIALRYE
ncbi:MAG TPA: ABC transporter permease [Candidatus Acidoferrales bacterium]|nr:ABC transporter permease [Candidatus Acidoferrales bacterium]